AIETALAEGRSAMLLVPEIALTPAMAGQFYARFGDRVAILHSAFTDTERAEQWRKIRSGAAGVVVGTRSGVFAPVRNLGLIDMRVEFLETRRQATFSRRLLEAVSFRLENGEQTMLLLNRRGFSSSVACRACGERVSCVNCAVTLTFHRRDRRMLCHYCNYAEKVPSLCPKCENAHMYLDGAWL